MEALTKIIIRQKDRLQRFDTDDLIRILKERNIIDPFPKKKSYYDSSHVQSLIILKAGLRKWKSKCVSGTKVSASGGEIFNQITKMEKELKNNLLNHVYISGVVTVKDEPIEN